MVGQTKTRDALREHIQSIPEFRFIKPVPLELFIKYLVNEAPLQLMSSDGVEVTRLQRCAIDLFIRSGCQESTSGLPQIKNGRIVRTPTTRGTYAQNPLGAEQCSRLRGQWPPIEYHAVYTASRVPGIREESREYKGVKYELTKKGVFAPPAPSDGARLRRATEHYESNIYIKRLLSEMIFDPGFQRRRDVYEMAAVLQRYENSWPWTALLQKYKDCRVEYPYSPSRIDINNNYRGRFEYGKKPDQKPPSPFLQRIMTEFRFPPPSSIQHGVSMLHDTDVVIMAVRDRILDEMSEVKYATLEKWRAYLADRCKTFGKNTNSLYSPEHEMLRQHIEPIQIAEKKRQRANFIERELQERQNSSGDELYRILNNEQFE